MDIEQAVRAVTEAVRDDPDNAASVYEQQLLPLELARLREQARSCDVLILTAGTQPYSIALSLVFSPAPRVYFLCTGKSRTDAERALTLARTYLPDVPETPFTEVPFDDATEVYRRIREIAERHRGERVVVNATSGTKPMTGGAQTIGAFLGLPTVYVSGREIARGPGLVFFAHQQAQVLASPFEVFGDLERARGVDAFQRHDFSLAESLFRRLEDAGVRFCHFGARAALCRAYGAAERLCFDETRDGLDEVLALLGRRPHRNAPEEDLYDQIPRLKQQRGSYDLLARATRKDSHPAFDPALANALARFLLSSARRRGQHEPDLAALLAYRAIELCVQRRLAVHGLDAAGPVYTDAEATLARYNQVAGPRFRLEELPGRLPLAVGRTLLQALGDEVISAMCTPGHLGRLKGAQLARNSSIYGHGFSSLRDAARRDGIVAVAAEHLQGCARADGLQAPDPDPVYDLIELR